MEWEAPCQPPAPDLKTATAPRVVLIPEALAVDIRQIQCFAGVTWSGDLPEEILAVS